MAHLPRPLARQLLIPGDVPHHGAVRTDGVWLRAAALGVLVAIGCVLALTVELPDVDAARAWVNGAGGAGWSAMVLGLALMLLTPVPRSAVSALVGLVAGFGPGLAVALAGACSPRLPRSV